jgi:hypothetical protein
MIYKYLYKSKVNGIKIRTDRKLDPEKYELILEFRDAQMKPNQFIMKSNNK